MNDILAVQLVRVVQINHSILSLMAGGAAFQYPQDIQKAQRHRLACRVFKRPDPENDGQDDEVCQCCHQTVGKKNFSMPFWYSPQKQLSFLGPGAPFLFTLTQNGIMYLISLGLIFVIYAVLTNLQGTSCNPINDCINDIYNSVSLANKIENADQITIQIFLIAAFMVFSIIFKQYRVYRVRRKEKQYDDKLDSPSDYSIIIKELPENVKRKDIQDMIEEKRKELTEDQYSRTNNLKVEEVFLSYDTRDYSMKKKEQEERFIITKKKDQSAQFITKKIAKPFKTGNFAIVVFQKQSSKGVFQKGGYVSKVRQTCFVTVEQGVEYEVKKKLVVVKRAPEPDDVLWENAHVTQRDKFINMILAFILGAIVLVVGAIIQYYLKYLDYVSKYSFDWFYTYLSPVILFIYDEYIVEILIITTKTEGHQTLTDLHKSLLIKVSTYSFLNVGVFFLLSQFFAYRSYGFSLLGGFAFDLAAFFVIKTFHITFVKYLKTKTQFPTCFKRFFLRNGYSKCTQKEANLLYEQKPFNFAIKYSFIIKTIWMAAFYTPFFPLLVPLAIVGLIFFYFTEKNLLRDSYKRPNMTTVDIAHTAGRLLDYSGPILFLGQLLVLIYIKYEFNKVWQEWTVTEIVAVTLCFVLSLFIFLFPFLRFNEYLFPMDNQPKQKPQKQELGQHLIVKVLEKQSIYPDYNQAKLKFAKTYEQTIIFLEKDKNKPPK